MSKLMVITLNPTALDADGLSTTETLLSTRLDYLINGAYSIGFDRNGICAAQTNGASAALSLNGAQGTDFSDRKGAYIQIFAGSDNTGITFEVVGTNEYSKRVSETITGPDAGLTVLGAVRFWTITSVTSSAAVTDNCEVGTNGYAVFSTPQHINSTHAGDDSGKTIIFTGEDRYGALLTETITGGSSAAVATLGNFARVDRITASAAGANAVTAGSAALCESGWRVLNYRGPDFNVGIGCTSAGATYAMQHTFSNVMATGFVESDAVVFTHDSISAKTANFDGNYTNPPIACRLAITTAGTGPVTATIVRGGGA
tara:strand:- start:70 stop:1014 length:945 start_codon:yes stop_codon:yes gene_type:complete